MYDLDACLWDQEMFEMDEMPGKVVRGDLNGKGEGVVGVMSGGHKISLHKGGLVSLQVRAVCLDCPPTEERLRFEVREFGVEQKFSLTDFVL